MIGHPAARAERRRPVGRKGDRWAGPASLAALAVLVLCACGGSHWEDRLDDVQVMESYRAEARATGTQLMDERLDDIARRLCRGWAAGESDEAAITAEALNTPALERSNLPAIADAAHRHVCPSE